MDVTRSFPTWSCLRKNSTSVCPLSLKTYLNTGNFRQQGQISRVSWRLTVWAFYSADEELVLDVEVVPETPMEPGQHGAEEETPKSRKPETNKNQSISACGKIYGRIPYMLFKGLLALLYFKFPNASIRNTGVQV